LCVTIVRVIYRLSMHSLHEIYARLKGKKAERRELKTSFQDELRNNPRYMEIMEEMTKLKAEKKSIENEILSREMDKAKFEELSVEIKTDTELLTDVALNKFLASEPVEIVDEINIRWVPAFTVKFKKA
jgi:hypothetical protein